MRRPSPRDFTSPRRLWMAAFALVLAVSVATPDALATPKDAETFVRERGAAAIGVLSMTGLNDRQYLREFETFVEAAFDVPAMAQFALGTYWRVATADQREEYVHLYKQYLVGTYARRFKQYAGEKFEVTGARPINGAENLVQSRIMRPAAAPIAIEWHVREQAGQQKVVDIVIEGLRLGVTLRDEFSGVIRAGGNSLDALFRALRERNATFAI